MSSHSTETHAIKLIDLPLLRRLNKSGTVLHSGLRLTQDARGPSSALLSSILFPRGLYTLVSRTDNLGVVGQFRYKEDDLNAHIVYLASTLKKMKSLIAHYWLHILDAMAQAAGKVGAHHLIAEVEPSDHLFETMRRAGFAVYCRQIIWRHDPFAEMQLDEKQSIALTEEASQDQMGIMALQASTIPTLLQQVMTPPSDSEGFVYRKAGRVESYVTVSEGKHGVYLIPYIHPDVLDETGVILQNCDTTHPTHEKSTCLYMSA